MHTKTLWEGLTVLLSTEGVSPVLLEVGSGAAPEVPICAALGGAGVESPSIVGERQDTGLPIRIATIRLGHGFRRKVTALDCGLKQSPNLRALKQQQPLQAKSLAAGNPR